MTNKQIRCGSRSDAKTEGDLIKHISKENAAAELWVGFKRHKYPNMYYRPRDKDPKLEEYHYNGGYDGWLCNPGHEDRLLEVKASHKDIITIKADDLDNLIHGSKMRVLLVTEFIHPPGDRGIFWLVSSRDLKVFKNGAYGEWGYMDYKPAYRLNSRQLVEYFGEGEEITSAMAKTCDHKLQQDRPNPKDACKASL